MAPQEVGVPYSLPRPDMGLVSKEASLPQCQKLTPLLIENVGNCCPYIIVPTSEKFVQSWLLPVDKKGTSEKHPVLDMSRVNRFIPLQNFPHDYSHSSETGNQEGFMDCKSGFEECILACSDSSKVLAHAGIQYQESGLQIYGNAFCPQYHT